MNIKTENKIQIADAAADLYLKNQRFTLESLAEASGFEKDEIYNYFPNRRAILEFFYESVLIQYEDLTEKIDGYKDFSLAEKLSNLAFTILDLFQEKRAFVQLTYQKLVLCSTKKSAFSEALHNQIKNIYENDPKQSRMSSIVAGTYLYKIGVVNFHLLVQFWLRDESTGYQKTMELVDKWTALVESLHYCSILDRGVDFGRFLLYNLPSGNPCKSSKRI